MKASGLWYKRKTQIFLKFPITIRYKKEITDKVQKVSLTDKYILVNQFDISKKLILHNLQLNHWIISLPSQKRDTRLNSAREVRVVINILATTRIRSVHQRLLT